SKIIRYAVVGGTIVTVLTSGIVYSQIHPATDSPSEFKVITYNIQQGYSNDGTFNYLGVYETLRDSGADIIGLQETETSRVTSLDMSIIQWLAWKLNMYAYEGPALNDLCYGIALLSRYPITSVELELMPSRGEQTAFISAMINLGGTTINVIVTHFGEYLDDRTAQAVAIYHYVEKLTSSRNILVGDFNTEYGEEPYNITTSIYLDAWLQIYPSGTNGTGFTGNTSGDHRIDMIFYYGLTCTAIEVLTYTTASDHKPVVATFSIE
ncbi:MAG: endonuclease/exonuclease/phosphatase family protein, partial [Candidatus Heimdallarchaeaceae archaeon]